MRKQGYSVDDSAVGSRDVSVDFSQGGFFSTIFNAAYSFFNASLVSTGMLIRSIGKHPISRGGPIVGSLFALGVIQALINDWATPDDDDPKDKKDVPVNEWQKRNKYKKSSSLAFWIGGKDGFFLELPLLYGFNIFVSAGTNFVDAMKGYITPGEMATEFIANALDVYAPVKYAPGNKESTTATQFWQTIVPSFGKAFVDVSHNAGFTGAPIHDKWYSDEQPLHEQAKNDTPAFWSSMAKVFNKLPLIKFYPDDYEYLVDQYFGAPGDIMIAGADAYSSWKKGIPFSPSKIPVVKRFYSPADRTGRFYKAFHSENERIHRILNKAKDDGLHGTAPPDVVEALLKLDRIEDNINSEEKTENALRKKGDFKGAEESYQKNKIPLYKSYYNEYLRSQKVFKDWIDSQDIWTKE
jgi:hypothetical protein